MSLAQSLARAYSRESLSEAHDAVAIAIATDAQKSVEVTLKRADGRETSAQVLNNYDAKLNFLTAARAALQLLGDTSFAPTNQPKSSFAYYPVDP